MPITKQHDPSETDDDTTTEEKSTCVSSMDIVWLEMEEGQRETKSEADKTQE